MDPTVIGTRLASGLVGPLVKRLFVHEGPGAGLVDKLVRELVERAARETREAPLDEGELEAVADALQRTLHALGDLDLDDLEAVRLGYEALADRLYRQAGGDRLLRDLSYDSTFLYFHLLNSSCLHILHFFTQRSTFVARTLVEQSRQLDQLIRLTDLLVERLTSRTAQDAAFEQQYARYLAARHSRLTIYGIDLNECRDWPLDTAYLSLEATRDSELRALPDDQAILFLNTAELTQLVTGGSRMERLRSVSLLGKRGSPTHLGPAVAAFPEMTTLNVHFTDELDLAPLAAHPCLRHVNTPGANRLLNADQLPAHIELNGASAAPS